MILFAGAYRVWSERQRCPTQHVDSIAFGLPVRIPKYREGHIPFDACPLMIVLSTDTSGKRSEGQPNRRWWMDCFASGSALLRGPVGQGR